MYGDGYVGNGQDSARARMLSKEREALFSRSEQEKKRMREETAAYRLGSRDSKFSSTSNSSEVLLVQQTVGLCSKEEYARKRQALEAQETPAVAAVEPTAGEGGEREASKKKKKKGKERVGSLSFAMDGEDEPVDEAELRPIKLKKNPDVEANRPCNT
ncbi:hypothetical protein AB1Y20_010693 [Prymnesium parvum]|uniref:Uncharacterized protein n=1 Tax=Prymnesium parvum TaxID=97485 RepID=A0AB34IS43_PRYPA